MNIFNQQSRTENVVKIALISEVCTILNLIFGFVYRSIFLYVLSAEYLGLNGLFLQVLQVLSLADLGIAGAITFRFYKPIKNNDVVQVGRLMNFFKFVYRIICLVILSVGLSILPFIKMFIKDPSEIPADVNIYFVYVLFLFQSASTYMFAYKQTLLVADQRQYTVSFFQMISNFLKQCLQTAFLLITKNYNMTLAINIITTVLGNFIVSCYVTKKYRPVFAVKEKLSKVEQKEILHDTKACMFHKVGGVVLNSTDNLIASKLVGLISVGLYSNYSLIIGNLTTLATQLLSNITASLGNMYASLKREERYTVYMKLIFVNLWFASTLTVCLYVLIDPFISLWVGDSMLLNKLTVVFLVIKFYLSLTRQVNMSYTSASGLFVKDIYRPFVEASINLILSIFFVTKIGLAGIFLGTIISELATVIWREPYLVFKHDFKRSPARYIAFQISFFAITLCMCGVFEYIFTKMITSFVWWILSAVIVLLLTELCLFTVFYRTPEFSHLKYIAGKILTKVLNKVKR